METSVRLLQGGFVTGPFATSLSEDGSRDELGEGILYGSLAMAFLPCNEGTRIERELSDYILANNGVVNRIEPIGEYADGRELNFDGETGLLAGISIRAARCTASPVLRSAWEARSRFYRENDGRIHPHSDEKLPGGFEAYRGAIDYFLAGSGTLDRREKQRLITEASLYASAQVPVKGPGYRIHLSWLYLLGLDYMDYAIDRSTFCTGVRGSGIEIIEHWCGRGDLEGWINSYQVNGTGYAWQRAKWESNRPAYREPGIDLLMALQVISR